jgi:hypothetical protein
MKLSCLVLIAGFVAGESAQAQTPPSVPKTPGMEAALKTVASACKSETPKLCPGLSTQTAFACLQSNIEKLSPGCKDAVVNAGKSIM